MLCPVSRAAVYKRVKEGKLTMFLYHPTERRTNFFGKSKEVVRQTPFALIPDSEIKAWRVELEARALKQGKLTEEELEGMKPDWSGKFMEWRKKR